MGGGKVTVRASDAGMELVFDASAIDPIDTLIRLELEGSAMDIPAIALDRGIRASASNVYRNQTEDYGPQMAFDGDPETRWATDAGTRQAWIAFELAKPLTVQRVRIAEAYGTRVQKFEFQSREGGEWKTVIRGKTIGQWFQEKIAPVKAREFRLQILEATEGPTITEIELIEK
jgi:hypothetical protein